MAKSNDKIAARLSQIIIKLNNAERLFPDEMVEEFGVSLRTIQRDFNERLAFLPMKKENGYFRLESYALGKLSIKDIQNFATISGIQSLYPSLDSEFIVDILNLKLQNSYLIKNQGFEDISHKKELFEQLSGAIARNSPIHFIYNDKQREVNPYKLVNNGGIWYLLADEDDRLKTYTFSKIQQIKWNFEIHFEPKKEFLEMIAKNDTNWFSDTVIEVVLEIDNEAKEYFLRKEILPNKKIIQQNDTTLIISTNISYDDEILRIVKYWMPYIKISSPSYLQDKFINILKNYIKRHNLS